MLATIDIVFIALYFLIILIVGFWSGHKQETEDYLIGDRNLNSLQATTTIFSSRIGAAILLTYTALVYLYGLGALWYFIGSVFGLFLFYFFGKKIKKTGRRTIEKIKNIDYDIARLESDDLNIAGMVNSGDDEVKKLVHGIIRLSRKNNDLTGQLIETLKNPNTI